MSNKTSFLGLSLLDTSSENSTHFKDWSRNINLEGDEDHKSDFQKIDEFAQKITKDMEERPAGVSSWEDLEEKPFGEIGVPNSETLEWDGTPTEIQVARTDETVYHLVSERAPSDEKLFQAGAKVDWLEDGVENSIELERFSDARGNVLYLEVFVVVYEDDAYCEEMDITFPKRGTYFVKSQADSKNVQTTKLYVPDYSFDYEVKKIDPKYLPGTMGDLTFTVNDNGIVTVTFADK